MQKRGRRREEMKKSGKRMDKKQKNKNKNLSTESKLGPLTLGYRPLRLQAYNSDGPLL